MPLLITLFLCSYPIVVHLSIHFTHAEWAVYYIAFFFVLPLPFQLLKLRCAKWFAGLSLLYSILLFWFASNQSENLLFAQPVIVNLLIFLLFLSTLVSGSVPLIGRITQLIKADVPDEVMQYCRTVTWVWASFFLLVAIVSLLLSVFSTIEHWSLFTNFVVYILIGVMFVVEYLVRRIVMKDYIDRSFVQFVRDLRKVDYRELFKKWRV